MKKIAGGTTMGTNQSEMVIWDGDYSVLEADRLLDAMRDITTDEDCTRCSDNPRIFGGCLECNPAKKYFQDNK